MTMSLLDECLTAGRLRPHTGVDDLALVERLSQGKVDLTYGSALDIFGGTQVRFDDLVAYNNKALEGR